MFRTLTADLRFAQQNRPDAGNRCHPAKGSNRPSPPAPLPGKTGARGAMKDGETKSSLAIPRGFNDVLIARTELDGRTGVGGDAGDSVAEDFAIILVGDVIQAGEQAYVVPNLIPA